MPYQLHARKPGKPSVGKQPELIQHVLVKSFFFHINVYCLTLHYTGDFFIIFLLLYPLVVHASWLCYYILLRVVGNTSNGYKL